MECQCNCNIYRSALQIMGQEELRGAEPGTQWALTLLSCHSPAACDLTPPPLFPHFEKEKRCLPRFTAYV